MDESQLVIDDVNEVEQASFAPIAPEVQQRAVDTINKAFDNYKVLLNWYRAKWYDLFRATYIFETDRKLPGQSTIFFPKAFEQIEKVTPRIIGENPKFVVSANLPVHPQFPEADMKLNAESQQVSLNYFWKRGNCQKKCRTWVKGGLIYGTMFAKVEFERKTHKSEQKTIKTAEDGSQYEEIVETETVVDEFPTFRVPDILDLYFDPRIELIDDMPSIIENVDQVRKADLIQQKDIYFNLDKVKDSSSQPFASDNDNYKMNKFTAEGIPQINPASTVSEDEYTNIKNYYGWFSETGKTEDLKMVLMTMENNQNIIRYEEIDFLPFEKFNPIEIPNQGVGMGLVEPIKKIQDAYNLTRNQRFENVSIVINRMWKMKQGAGIDPRRLRSFAGNVIPVKNPDDLIPIETPDITGSAFNEANALNTEIQTTLGTIDTTQESGQNGFSNLATGQKIRWNEYNVRFKAIKENFEEALGRLGEKMLRMVGKHANQNPLVYDEVTRQFYEVAKTAYDSVSDFYGVTVLADSTSYDSMENKRDDVLTLNQLAFAFKGQGVNVPMDKLWQDTVDSFGKDPQAYILPPEPQQQAPSGTKNINENVIEDARVQPSPADQLNNQLTNV